MLPVNYVPRLEFDEVKTALEIAEEEYQRAVNEADKWDKISCEISDKCGEYNDVLEVFNKEFRNLEGRYKRSTQSNTRARLYSQMVILRRQIEDIEPAVDCLQRMYDKAATQYLHKRDKELAATRNVINARAAAGLKYSVCVNIKCGDKQILLKSNVKTIADAVNFVCQNANGLVNWLIYTESVDGLTTRRNVIAESKNIDSEIFFALIKKYGDSTTVIDAEIAFPQKQDAPHFDTPAGEFKAIAFRAMHYFTLGDFLTPIEELRAFCRKNKLPYAERELAEWIQIATDNGVEVPAEQPAKLQLPENFAERRQSPLFKAARKFSERWHHQGEYYGKGGGLLDGVPAILEEWRAALNLYDLSPNLIKAFDDAVRQFNESAYAKDIGVTVDFYNQQEPDNRQEHGASDSLPAEPADAVTQISKFGVKVITSKPNKRGALICYVNGEKISYKRAEELYRNHFSDGKVIWCYGLSEAETAERIKQALANNPFAVESFSLAPADLPETEEFTSDGIIRDTQFAVCAITNWLPVIRRHEKIIGEWKAERAALCAGIITTADLKHDDVPDFCDNEIFNINHCAAHLRQNISGLKAGIAVLTTAGYLQRTKDFSGCLIQAFQAEKRLDFL